MTEKMTHDQNEEVARLRKEWQDVKHKYHISPRHLKMAQQIGLNPNQFKKLNKQKRQEWRETLYERIEKVYQEQFGYFGSETTEAGQC